MARGQFSSDRRTKSVTCEHTHSSQNRARVGSPASQGVFFQNLQCITYGLETHCIRNNGFGFTNTFKVISLPTPLLCASQKSTRRNPPCAVYVASLWS